MSKKQKTPPTAMFEYEDLPLFSGTPVKAHPAAYVPTAAPARQLSFAACPLCLATGKVGEHYCTCEHGLIAKNSQP